MVNSLLILAAIAIRGAMALPQLHQSRGNRTIVPWNLFTAGELRRNRVPSPAGLANRPTPGGLWIAKCPDGEF